MVNFIFHFFIKFSIFRILTDYLSLDKQAAMPFAIIGSDEDVIAPDGRKVKGRQYSWGIAEVENEDHCDFKKLRSLLIR